MGLPNGTHAMENSLVGPQKVKQSWRVEVEKGIGGINGDGEK